MEISQDDKQDEIHVGSCNHVQNDHRTTRVTVATKIL